MPNYRIHRMRDHARASFRNAPHTSGTAQVKPRDFLPVAEIDTVEAASPYAAWHALLGADQALTIGDMLEAADGADMGQLYLCKYVGFDKAQWVKPEATETADVQAANAPAVQAAQAETAPAR